MKKFAAICLALVLVLSMAVIAVSAAQVTGTTAVGSGTGTLNVYKKSDSEPADAGGTVTPNNPSTKKNLPGAGFTVYKVMSYGGTSPNQYFSFTDPYVSDTNVQNYATNNLTLVSGQTNKYVTYGDTDDLEGLISVLEGINNTTTALNEVLTGNDGKATFTNLDKGVYLVKETTIPSNYSASSQSFLVAILEDNQVVNAYPKNQKMEIDKNILTGTEYTAALTTPTAGTGTDATNLSIGDTVNYQIESQVPNYDTDAIAQMNDKTVNIVKITDTLSNGLTFSEANKDALKVFAGTNDITSVVTITRTDDQHFSVEVSLDDVYTETPAKNYLGQKLYVVYQATVNSNAVVTSGNNNTAQLEYKNSPSDDAYNPTPVPVPDEKVPVVYTYQMEVKKLLDGEAVTGNPSVANLTFVLKQGDNYVQVSGSDGVYKVTSDHANDATNTTMNLKSTDGTLTLTGLSAGTYTLTESGSVSGYTTLQSPLVIVVNDENTTTNTGRVTATVNGANTTTKTEEVANPDYNATYKAEQDAYLAEAGHTAGDAGYPHSEYNNSIPATITQNTGRFAFEINNPSSQFDLPTTGGYGILIFTLSGAVVLAAAIIIFTIARKKKENK